jgi:hypothetical protein
MEYEGTHRKYEKEQLINNKLPGYLEEGQNSSTWDKK